MSEEMVPYANTRGIEPAEMIATALQSGADLEKLERLLDLQLRWEANEAKKAFNKAMAAFKANPPKIGKDRHVSFNTSKGMTQYDHASLANVTSTISKKLSEHGLSISWRTDQADKIKVTCCVTHSAGHQECTSLSADPDISGGKNAIQAIGSTVAYLERYTALAITGLATHDQDTDGIPPKSIALITDDQVRELEALLDETGTDYEKWKAFYKIDSVADVPASEFEKVKKLLQGKLSGGKK